MAPDNRRKITFTPDEYDRIEKAAYWEGFRDPKSFVLELVNRFTLDRRPGRGADYGKPRWGEGEGPEE